MQQRLLYSAALLGCLLVPGSARAWDLVVDEVIAHSFTSLPCVRDSRAGGTNPTIRAPEDTQFLVLTGRATVRWTEQENNASIRKEDIQVKVGDEACRPAGLYLPGGVFYAHTGYVGLSFRRANDEAASALRLNAVFLVPREGEPVLEVKDATVSLKPSPGPAPDPAAGLAVTVEGCVPYVLPASKERTFSRDVAADVDTRLVVGKLVGVTISVTPKAANCCRGGKPLAIVETQGFDLVARGVSLPTKRSSTVYWQGEDRDAKKLELVFHVPEDFTGGKLLYCGIPVAEASL